MVEITQPGTTLTSLLSSSSPPRGTKLKDNLIVFPLSSKRHNRQLTSWTLTRTGRSTIHGVLATHLAIQGIQAKGCGNCPLYCSVVKSGTSFWRNVAFSEGNRAHKPGNRVHLAVTNTDDENDSPDPVMLAINRAFKDDLLDHDLCREIVTVTKIHDFARLEVLSARCDQDVDNRAKNFHAFLSSLVTGPGDSPFLEVHPDMQRRVADASVDRYFPVEDADVDRERTRRTNNFYSSFS